MRIDNNRIKGAARGKMERVESTVQAAVGNAADAARKTLKF